MCAKCNKIKQYLASLYNIKIARSNLIIFTVAAESVYRIKIALDS